jgi:hypothetical protein
MDKELSQLPHIAIFVGVLPKPLMLKQEMLSEGGFGKAVSLT